MKKNIALVGLGPHAKRIYLNYIKKHRVKFKLLIDLESQENIVREYLDENGFKNTQIFTIPDKYKDHQTLPKDIANKLLDTLRELDITHLIISTEPKGHNMYLELALKNNINVLTDKPITVTKNMTSKKNVKKVRNQYYNLLKLSEQSNAMCKVMCQRQYHKGYEYVKKLLNDIVNKYQVPITYIDIYHCDGNWEMPHDLEKENHPYKYGYGKLFHSGYHFIDLLSDLLKINNQLPESKKIKNGEIYSNCFTPNDELAVFNNEDYKRIFKKQQIPEYYNDKKNKKFNDYGEKNFYGLLKFTNKYNQTITTANLNLLHYGFSRRGWIETKDFYKKNGRIRHERVNIQVGTLFNIQIHSYQSKEIKDRTDELSEEQVGGLEHFDIDIYRNVDIIGGKPFERIKLGDLYTEKEKEDILGYNELSREQYLNNFLRGKCDKGDIKDQALAIEILSSCATGICNHYKKKNKKVKINVKNKYINPITIKSLKKCSYKGNVKEKKKLIDTFKILKEDNYEFGGAINYLKKKNTYEIFSYVLKDNEMASMLLYKEISNKFFSKLYFYLLKQIFNYKKSCKLLNLLALQR